MEWLLVWIISSSSAWSIPGLLTFCPDSTILPGCVSFVILVSLIKFFEHRVFGELVWLDTSGRLGEPSSLGDPSERDSPTSSSPRPEPRGLEEDELRNSFRLCLKESPNCLLKYSFWFANSSLRAWMCSQFLMTASKRSSRVMLELIVAHGQSGCTAVLRGVLCGWKCVWLRVVFGLKIKAKEKP